jgi:hypothetical protein
MIWWWIKVLDIGLTFWVLRGPLVAVGAVILLLVPQAQDLLVEPVTDGFIPPLLLGLGVMFARAMPTHYAARLLVNTDARYGRRMGTSHSSVGKCGFRSCVVTWFPRLLAVSIFAILIGAAFKARLNIPDLKDQQISEDVRGRLVWLATAFGVLMAVFLVYAVGREKVAAWRPIRSCEWSFAYWIELSPRQVHGAVSPKQAFGALSR